MPRINRFAVCGSGFIGKGLVRQLISQGYMVNVLGRNVCPDEFPEKTQWVTDEFADCENLRNTLDGVEVACHQISSAFLGDDMVDPHQRAVGEHILNNCVS